MNLSSSQEKERRNLLVFCSAIIMGNLMEISIQELSFLGYKLANIPVEKIEIAGSLVLLYFLVNHTITTVSFRALFHESILDELSDFEKQESNEGALEKYRYSIDTRAKLNDVDKTSYRFYQVHRYLNFIMIILLPYILIVTAYWMI